MSSPEPPPRPTASVEALVDTQLREGAQRGSMAAVRAALDRGANCNCKDKVRAAWTSIALRRNSVSSAVLRALPPRRRRWVRARGRSRRRCRNSHAKGGLGQSIMRAQAAALHGVCTACGRGGCGRHAGGPGHAPHAPRGPFVDEGRGTEGRGTGPSFSRVSWRCHGAVGRGECCSPGYAWGVIRRCLGCYSFAAAPRAGARSAEA